MQSQIDKKRNIFKASLRREYIDSYQRKIRMKYLEEERKKSTPKIFSKIQEIIANLEAMLMLTSEQISTIDNFEYLMESAIAMVNGGIDKEQENSLSLARMSQGHYWEGYFNRGGNSFSTKAMLTPSPYKRPRKERIQSLIYKIMEKSFNESSGRLRFVLDKIFYLLQYPELMPLWEKLSQISEKVSKQKCCVRFTEILESRNPFAQNSNEVYQTNILDPNFALDVLMNFAVESPEISFQFSLKFMPYLAYCLKDDKVQEVQFARLDKVSFILRSFLKTEGKIRVCRLIQEGYQSVLIGFMKALNVYNIGQQQPANYQKQCIYSSSKQPLLQPHSSSTSDWPKTKINILKLINRIFVVHSQAGQYLYGKCSSVMLEGLFRQVLARNTVSCRPYIEANEEERRQMSRKYQYIILCDRHRSIIKHTLLTLSTIMMSCRTSSENREHTGERILEDFLRFDGLEFLQVIISTTDIIHEYKKELTTVLSVLDSSQEFYTLLSPQHYQLFFNIATSVFIHNTLREEDPEEEQHEQLLEDSYTIIKLLKCMKNCLLRAYSRATDPTLFEELSAKVLFTMEIKRKLLFFLDIDQQGQQQIPPYFSQHSIEEFGVCSSATNIKNLSAHIIQLCEDPKTFIDTRRRKSESRNRISQNLGQRM